MIHFPTDVGTIVGRWAVNGEGDLTAVKALQAELTLAPTAAGPGNGLPTPNPAVAEEIAFLSRCGSGCRRFRQPDAISPTSSALKRSASSRSTHRLWTQIPNCHRPYGMDSSRAES